MIEGAWRRVTCDEYAAGTYYRIPLDVVPTEESLIAYIQEHGTRPYVFVRDDTFKQWNLRLLAAAYPNYCYAFSELEWQPIAWRYCRYPYPGEPTPEPA